MKTKIFALATVLLLSGFAASLSYAEPSVLVTNIPFEFQVGNQTLPPGDYRLETQLTGSARMQLLRQVDTNRVVILSTLPIESQAEGPDPMLVFHRYGQTYFLAQIWNGTPEGRQLPESNREKEMARWDWSSEISLLLHPTIRATQLRSHSS
jgi:hypothetical protein